MDISTVLVFVAGVLITPLIAAIYWWVESSNRRRFRKAKFYLGKAGYEAVLKTDPRIQEWGSKADARRPGVVDNWLTEKY